MLTKEDHVKLIRIGISCETRDQTKTFYDWLNRLVKSGKVATFESIRIAACVAFGSIAKYKGIMNAYTIDMTRTSGDTALNLEG